MSKLITVDNLARFKEKIYSDTYTRDEVDAKLADIDALAEYRPWISVAAATRSSDESGAIYIYSDIPLDGCTVKLCRWNRNHQKHKYTTRGVSEWDDDRTRRTRSTACRWLYRKAGDYTLAYDDNYYKERRDGARNNVLEYKYRLSATIAEILLPFAKSNGSDFWLSNGSGTPRKLGDSYGNSDRNHSVYLRFGFGIYSGEQLISNVPKMRLCVRGDVVNILSGDETGEDPAFTSTSQFSRYCFAVAE